MEAKRREHLLTPDADVDYLHILSSKWSVQSFSTQKIYQNNPPDLLLF